MRGWAGLAQEEGCGPACLGGDEERRDGGELGLGERREKEAQMNSDISQFYRDL